MNRTGRILIIESSEIIRKGLVEILRGISHVNKIDQVESWEQFIQIMNNNKYDTVLINPILGSTGIRLKPQVLDKLESTTLIAIITTTFSREFQQDYDDIIFLNDDSSTIRKTISKHLIDKTGNLRVHQLLSDREIEVLKQIAKGMPTKEIADTLNISTHTVISHRKNISSKLGIKTASGMAIYAVTARIIDPSDILGGLPKKRD